MIEQHKKILGKQATAGQFRKKKFDRNELIEKMKKEGFSEWEIEI